MNADLRRFWQMSINLIRGGVLVTGRPGSPERAQTSVITGESQAQAGGLAGPFCDSGHRLWFLQSGLSKAIQKLDFQ